MLIALLATATASTLTVEADGSGDYTSITAAINAAGQGDEISIGAGTWYEALSLGSKNLTLIGTSGVENVILDASGQLSAITTQDTATISDLTIRNDGGRGLTVSGSGTITVSGVIFDDVGSDDEYGGAIQINGGEVELIESTIDGGSAASGMIYITNGSSLIATDSTIKESTASYGAGIYISSGSATLDGCTLEQLYTTGDGGAVYLQIDTSLSATDTTFYANLTENGNGAAIYAYSASIEVTDSTFDLNYSTNYTDGYSGGAVYLSGGQMTATRTSFTENLAYYGGAVRMYNNATLALVDSEFSDNWANYGGALYADTTVTIEDSGSAWVGNESYYYGAAIYAYTDFTMSFEGSEFIGNYARYGYGGGVYAYSTGSSEFTDVTFDDNYAYYGGAGVYAYYTYGDVFFEGCTFNENTALYYGGAIHSSAYNNIIITDSTFTYNESQYSYGGAIYNYYSNLTIRRSEFTANRSLESMGGAIYSYYYYSAAPDLVIEDSSFSSNEARYHGGAVASLYNRYEIKRSSFHVNDTEGNGMGGAIFTQDTHSGLVLESSFTGNNAGYGGAVYSDYAYSGTDQWLNNIFVENTANIGGAMVFSKSDVTSIINNTFVGNSSVEAGGNLVLVDSGVEFVNNAVTHSTAGVGVMIYDEESLKNSRFDYNAWYEISDGLGGGTISDKALLSEGSLDGVDPAYTTYSPDGTNNDGFVLLRDSELIDAGDPSLLDPDGTPSDIGAWGGSEFLVEDADGDGYDNWQDCDDTDPDVHPDASDAFYDGINSDCLSGSDYDADGDGADSDVYGGTDCDDSDASLQSDCGGDTIIDTGDPEETETEQPVPNNDNDQDKKGCSHVSGGAGLFWLVGLLGVVRRRD